MMYDRKKSTTYEAGDSSLVKLRFGTGPVHARKAYETVRVGDIDPPMQTKHMLFMEVVDHNLTVWESGARFSVIAGLGRTSKHISPKDMLLQRLGITRFSICLEREGWEAPGWLTFQPEVNSVAGSTFRTVPLIGKAAWAVKLSSAKMGLDSKKDPCNATCGAIVDSGTSFIVVHKEAYKSFADVLDRIASDCSNLDELPDLELVLGTHRFSLPPAAYVFDTASLNSPDGSNRKHSCRPAIYAKDYIAPLGPIWILGMPFLRYYYTVFDRQGSKLHIAPAGQDCLPEARGVVNFVAHPRWPRAEPVRADFNAALFPSYIRTIDL
eukprot:gnl/TRDRNA2_/TRDRNA2_133890_c1_seq1.p1 gnl/TRDRNA2_/TRDRNA2_133890_c1~~gnl/TRDRNA2_/TRDRNA2_133890_c1_seq1.p1  ORF type:complete len:324 (+),score=32.93 gnl/TRDRNA2_/TRDRNA2_133890_c1_seq1:30-1001(+)